MSEPWRIQWHIAADGTVIKQRSRGNESHQQLYSRYSMAREADLGEIYAMEEHLRGDSAHFTRLTRNLLYLVAVAGAALVVGLVLLAFVDGAQGVSVVLVIAGLVVCVGAALAIMPIYRSMNQRFQRRYRDAGFESPAPVTMAASEARALNSAQGAESGRKLSVERA